MIAARRGLLLSQMGVASHTLSASIHLANVFFHSNKKRHQKMSTLTRDEQLCSFVFYLRAVLILSPSLSVVSPSLPRSNPIFHHKGFSQEIFCIFNLICFAEYLDQVNEHLRSYRVSDISNSYCSACKSFSVYVNFLKRNLVS